MRHRITITVISALFIIFLSPASSLSSSEFSPNEVSSLTQGSIVRRPISNGKGSKLGGTSFILVDAPPEKVWNALFSFNRYPDIFPRTMKTSVVARKPGSVLLDMEQGSSLIGVNYSLSATYDRDKMEIVCRMVRSRPHDLSEVQGFWRLIPQKDGRTLVAYGAVIGINSGLIKYWAGDVIERGLLNAPRDLKKYIESGSI